MDDFHRDCYAELVLTWDWGQRFSKQEQRAAFGDHCHSAKPIDSPIGKINAKYSSLKL
jgi:hypothetical protein